MIKIITAANSHCWLEHDLIKSLITGERERLEWRRSEPKFQLGGHYKDQKRQSRKELWQ